MLLFAGMAIEETGRGHGWFQRFMGSSSDSPIRSAIEEVVVMDAERAEPASEEALEAYELARRTALGEFKFLIDEGVLRLIKRGPFVNRDGTAEDRATFRIPYNPQHPDDHYGRTAIEDIRDQAGLELVRPDREVVTMISRSGYIEGIDIFFTVKLPNDFDSTEPHVPNEYDN